MRTQPTEFYNLPFAPEEEVQTGYDFGRLESLVLTARALPLALSRLVVSFLRPAPVTAFCPFFHIAADGEPARILDLIL